MSDPGSIEGAAAPETLLAQWRRAVQSRRDRDARPPALVRRVALALALALHLSAALWLAWLMRPTRPDQDSAIAVRLIDALPEVPALPEPPGRPRTLPAPAAPRMLPAPAAPVESMAREPAPEATPELHLIDSDGSIRLPGADVGAGPAPDAFVAAAPVASAVMGPHRPLKIRPNYFAGVWRAPVRENLLGSSLRHIGEFVEDHLTAEKEFTLPDGSKVKCSASVLLLMAKTGCGWGYAPEWGTPTEHWKPASVLDEH